MAYLETYKGVRVFRNEAGEYYAIDGIMRKSLPYDSLRQLKADIITDTVQHKLPVPMDNSEAYIRSFFQKNSHVTREVVETKETEELNEQRNQEILEQG